LAILSSVSIEVCATRGHDKSSTPLELLGSFYLVD
jgi:hypothetical protein